MTGFNNRETVNINTPDLLRHKLVVDTLNKTITLDEEEPISYTKDIKSTLRLFGNSKVKIYSYKVKNAESQEVELDLIPVLYENAVCMYDEVSETFLYNNGTGDFIGE